MYSHAPKDYVCPICLALEGTESEGTLISPSDIIYKGDAVTALINSFFVGKNPGHVIIVPNEHYENIYDLPTSYGKSIAELTNRVAKALKSTYICDGITVRQNNEPAGDQHAFHYHVHVFPRYKNDGFNMQDQNSKRLAEVAERATYAKKLKEAMRRQA